MVPFDGRCRDKRGGCGDDEGLMIRTNGESV